MRWRLFAVPPAVRPRKVANGSDHESRTGGDLPDPSKNFCGPALGFADDHDGAGCVLDAVLADRAEQCADEAAVAALPGQVADRLGRLDILVNNAGVNIRKRPEDLAAGEWHQVMDANLTSAFLCAKACYPLMKRVGGGKIVNNGSMLSIFGAPWSPVYGASKGGVVQLTKSLAIEYAARNIRFNTVALGIVRTPMHAPETHDALAGLHPVGRIGEIDEVVDAITFLEQAGFVTGEILHVDGGQSAGH